MHHTVFDDSTATGTIPVSIYWVLVIEIVNGIGIVVTACSMFEFAMAQVSNRMRGIMMGMGFAVTCFGALEGYLLTAVLHRFPTATPSCVFYYYPVTITTHAVDTSSVCHSCQALQAE